MGLNVAILPVVIKDISISPRFTPYEFLTGCNFSILTTRPPLVEFYLLTLSATEEKIKNAALTRIELTTSALAGMQVTD